MRRGEIVENRDVFSLFNKPESEYTQKLLAEMPKL